MIEAIEEIKGVGILKNATGGTAISFGKVTLIYAENARGKSTFADLLRTFSLGDHDRVNARKHWYDNLDPLVRIKVDGTARVFTGGKWLHQGPNIQVFDARFTEENVHSGHNLEPAHREKLHHFVLGEEAVRLQTQYDTAHEKERNAKLVLQQAETALEQVFLGQRVTDVVKWKPLPDFQKAIADAEKNLADALAVETKVKRPSMKRVAWQRPDLTSCKEVLSRTLSSVSAAAEQQVRAQIQKVNKPGTESWISQGIERTAGTNCPFCDQDIQNSKLIAAYRGYFDAAYAKLKSDAKTASVTLSNILSESTMLQIRNVVEGNIASCKQWESDLALVLATIDCNSIESSAKTLRQELSEIGTTKIGSPLEAVDPARIANAEARLIRCEQLLNTYDSTVQKANIAIEAYKTKLQAADAKALQQERDRIASLKRRFDKDVVDLVTSYEQNKSALAEATKLKKEKRDELDAKMGALLQDLQGDINDLLTKFGARFRIKECESTNVGAVKRVEYGLDFEGIDVEFVGQKTADIGRSFGVALSEGDRRTLALAFFLSRLKKDPKIADTIVVLDDPICSLGEHRRQATLEELAWLSSSSHQLILLCHERHFIREARDKLTRKNGPTIAVLELKQRAVTGPVFAAADIDKLCESSYRRGYRLVEDFVNSNGVGNEEKVASSLRIVLEGYMNRKFVGRFSGVNGLGGMVQVLKAENPQSSFISIANRETELNNLNDYALKFHHDGSDDWQSPVPNAQEVLSFAKRTLALLHG